MTGRVLPFPSLTGQRQLRRAERVETEYDFARVARLLGLHRLDARTQVEQLRLLAGAEAMPLPKNPRFWGGKRQLGPASIGKKSLWDAATFDEWRRTRGSNDSPRPAPRPPHGGAGQSSLRAAMQDRARRLKAR